MLKNVLKGAGSDAIRYFPVRLVPAITSLVTVPVFTRMVDAHDYGNFYLVSSAITVAATLATSWVAGSAVRFYWTYEKEERLDDYVGTTVWATVLGVVLVGAVSGLGVWFLREHLTEGILRLVPVGLATLAINHFVKVMLQVLRAADRASTFALLSITATLLGTAFSVLLVAAFGSQAGPEPCPTIESVVGIMIE